VTTLAEELHVSPDLARMAVNEASGELEQAREILVSMLPKYLAIKVKFISRRQNGITGLIFIVMQKKVDRFLIFRTVSESNREWVKPIKVHRPPDTFFRTIKDYFDSRSTSLHLFDAQKLKDGIASRLSPSGLQYLFDLWDIPKHDIIPEGDPVEQFQKPGDILYNVFTSALEDIMVDKVQVEIDYDFYTETQFAPFKESLGLVRPSERKKEQAEKEESAGLKVCLKGQFIIDPVAGTPVHEIDKGMVVYSDILDRSDVAVSIGRLIGAYKKGLWLPIRGRVVEAIDATGDRKKFQVKVSSGVYIDILSLKGIKVRTTKLSSRQRVEKAQETKGDASMTPLLIAVSLMAFLIIVLLMLR